MQLTSGFTKALTSGNSFSGKRILHLGGARQNYTNRTNRTYKEALAKSVLNKKKRERAKRKKNEINEEANVLKQEHDPNMESEDPIRKEISLNDLIKKQSQ